MFNADISDNFFKLTQWLNKKMLGIWKIIVKLKSAVRDAYINNCFRFKIEAYNVF